MQKQAAMKMKSCTAAILLLISLQAVVDGRLSAAATDDGVIRLPSHGLADEIMASARKSGGVKRPWNCCDTRECTVGCPRLEGVAEAATAMATEDASPWKCCDKSWCTRSMPPICHCNDEVKMCAKTCKNCEKVVGSKGASSRYICRDTYGKVAPECTNKTVAADVRRDPAVSGDETKAVEAATAGPRLLNSTDQFSYGKTEAVGEKSVADGEEDASPWKCCDKAWCTRSMPPICHCNDEVKKCAKNCKVCEKANKSSDASSRYICRDSYGKPGPPCTKSVAADVRRGN